MKLQSVRPHLLYSTKSNTNVCMSFWHLPTVNVINSVNCDRRTAEHRKWWFVWELCSTFTKQTQKHLRHLSACGDKQTFWVIWFFHVLIGDSDLTEPCKHYWLNVLGKWNEEDKQHTLRRWKESMSWTSVTFTSSEWSTASSCELNGCASYLTLQTTWTVKHTWCRWCVAWWQLCSSEQRRALFCLYSSLRCLSQSHPLQPLWCCNKYLINHKIKLLYYSLTLWGVKYLHLDINTMALSACNFANTSQKLHVSLGNWQQRILVIKMV